MVLNVDYSLASEDEPVTTFFDAESEVGFSSHKTKVGSRSLGC